MIYRFLILLYTILCLIVGFGVWYLILWLFTNQANPLFWTLLTKIIYVLCSATSTETLRNVDISIQIKKKNNE